MRQLDILHRRLDLVRFAKPGIAPLVSFLTLVALARGAAAQSSTGGSNAGADVELPTSEDAAGEEPMELSPGPPLSSESAAPQGAAPPPLAGDPAVAAAPPQGTAVPKLPSAAPPPGVSPAGASAPEVKSASRPGELKFAFHGFFCAPLRIGLSRSDGPANSSRTSYSAHFPRSVDDNYSNFGYTTVQEGDWSELYLSVESEHVTGTAAIMGSLYTDAASSPIPSRQSGIAQGWVTLRDSPSIGRTKVNIELKVGSYWNRFGWLTRYNTYLIGRTHVLGETSSLVVPAGQLTWRLLEGFGADRPSSGDPYGFTLLHQLHVGVQYKRSVDVGLYHLRAWSNDTSPNGTPLSSSTDLVGADVRITSPIVGNLYLVGSRINAHEAAYLAPALEVMHSSGGDGLATNYFGTQSSDHGTGSLTNFGFQLEQSLTGMVRHMRHRDEVPPNDRDDNFDVSASVFALYTHIRSDQVSADPAINRDNTEQYKWGTDIAVRVLPWLGLSARYDNITLDPKLATHNFSFVSPRITMFSHWLSSERVYIQYSRYFFGEQVFVAGSAPGQLVRPDQDVVKIQAQMAF